MKRSIKVIISAVVCFGYLNAADSNRTGDTHSWKTTVGAYAYILTKNTLATIGNATVSGFSALVTLLVCEQIGRSIEKAGKKIRADAWRNISTTDSSALFFNKYGNTLFAGAFIAGWLVTARFAYKTIKSVKNTVLFVDQDKK